MVKSLDKKWKELLYAASGLGPNFLMVLMGAYYTDAINPVALGSGHTYQAIASGTCFILPALFPVLYTIGKIFDGVIDIPFAQITDSLSTRFGRRRPPIAVCILPMIVSYALCWVPVGGASNQLLNTIWFFAWSLVFFATYTMCLIAFYGSLSTTCSDENQRARVSGYKSFFDTINYCFVYALVPLLLDVFKITIDKFVFRCLPVMLTITIPLFMIKEGKKYGYPEGPGLKEKKISLLESFKMTFQNKVYIKWLVVECLTIFGLQMFLVSMNAIMIGGMGFNGTQMAIANTAAFAPVPVMIYLFNKLKAKRGVRFTYQTCLAAFAIGIFGFFFGSKFFLGEGKVAAQMIISIIGGVIASWAIGPFFMMPYLSCSQIASVEEDLTGINHSAMYFAAEALCTSVVGAISASLLYENIKMLFVSHAGKIVYAANSKEAASLLGLAVNQVFNLGTLLVPFIVAVSCIAGILFARKMPYDYSKEQLAIDFKKYDPSLNIENIVSDKVNPMDRGEFVFVQVALTILSGCVFGFIWPAFLFCSIKALSKKGNCFIRWFLSCMVPFAGGFVLASEFDRIKKLADEKNIKLCGSKALFIILGFIFPVMPINIVGLALLQANVNRVLVSQ